MENIINKVAQSGLIQMDLADFKNNLVIVGIDLKENLWQEFVLKEVDFRAWVKSNDWTIYDGKAVYIYCSNEAIIPTWAFMLVSAELTKLNVPHIVGSMHDLEKILIQHNIDGLKIADFIDGKLIIKGCSDFSDPAWVMVQLLQKLQPIAKSIMYGEPCSTVPIYKRK